MEKTNLMGVPERVSEPPTTPLTPVVGSMLPSAK
jgi:hypothetical protein